MVFDASSAKNSWQVSTACIVEGILNLISSRPAADRDELHAVRIGDRDRKLLKSDSSPLRDEYINCQDDEILSTLIRYFTEVKSNLWDPANDRSFIYRTVGVSALFDVLRFILLKYEKGKTHDRIVAMLNKTRGIDFSNPFFQASGKGRVRLKNVILRAANEIGGADLPKADSGAYAIYAQTTGAYK
jgi:hypothetical protein